MTERAHRLARAEQIIRTHIEDKSLPDPVVFAAAAQHAQAIATVELARAARAGVLLDILARPTVVAALDPDHQEAILAELRDFVGTIQPHREDTPA